LNQGVQAVDRGMAANGLFQSGAVGKALMQYGQGLAGSYGQQYLGGLQNLSALGEGATQSTASAGAGAANQIQSAQIYGGQASAAGDINTANAITSGLNQGIGLYGLAKGWGQQQQQQPYSSYNDAGGVPYQAYQQTAGGMQIPPVWKR
jgi:hypothetical protein